LAQDSSSGTGPNCSSFTLAMAITRVLFGILLQAMLRQASCLRAAKREVPQLVLMNRDPSWALHSMPGLAGHFVPKMGITSTSDLLGVAVPDFHSSIRGTILPSDFHIGTIRNPCDWYVSLWAYSVDTNNMCQGKDQPPDHVTCGSELRKELRRVPDGQRYLTNSSTAKDSDEDIAKFRALLRRITGNYENATGSYTARAVAGYAGAGPWQFDMSLIDERAAAVFRQRLAAFNTSSINCWVDTGRVTDGVRGCLRAYEKVGGQVQWEAFEARAKLMDDHTKEAHINPSVHQPCSRYFDSETEAFVRRIDDVAFSKFGYDRCCGGVSGLSALADA